MLRIGVTGGIGSGKTTVCRFFEELGVPVLSADKIAKSLSETDPQIRTKLRRILGRDAYTADGRLNRKIVADAIFANPMLVRKVNAVVHPKAASKILKQLRRLERNGEPLAIVEAALIYEGGLDANLDVVIVVHTALRKRKERAASRRGFSAKDIIRRQRAQWPAEKKKKLADVVIENNGTRRDLKRTVRHLHKILILMTTGKKP